MRAPFRELPPVSAWRCGQSGALPGDFRREGLDVSKMFRDWEGAVALYAPWDRFTVEKHDANWLKNYPGFEWNAERSIVHYLRLTREVLHSDEYTGC